MLGMKYFFYEELRAWMFDLMRDRRCEPYYLEFHFERLPAPTAAALDEMRPAVERLHEVLAAHAGDDEGPLADIRAQTRLIAAPARSMSPSEANGIEGAQTDGGLHMRAVLLLPWRSRLAGDLERRIRQHARREHCRIDVERVDRRFLRETAVRLFEDPEGGFSLMQGLVVLP